MTAITTMGAGRAPSGRSRIRAVIQMRLRAFEEWRRQRENLRALRSLSDHTLRDIGLHRTELSSIASLEGHDPSRRRRGAGRMLRLRSLF